MVLFYGWGSTVSRLQGYYEETITQLTSQSQQKKSYKKVWSMFKVNDKNTRTLELIKTPERRHWRLSGVFIVNFEHISHLSVVFLLLT